MKNHQKHGLCYNCDEKYSPGNKCKEYKLFHMDFNISTHFEEIIMKDTPKVEMVDHTPPMQEVAELEILQQEAIISMIYHAFHPLKP